MSPAGNLSPAKKAVRPHRGPATAEYPAIFKYRDATDLPAVDADRLYAGSRDGVFVEGPGKVRRFKRYAPLFHDDPDGVGLFSEFIPDTITYPPVFVAAARNARVVGFRTLLSEEGFFFNDDSTPGTRQRQRFLAQIAMPEPLNEETGLKRIGASNRFALEPGGRATERVEGLAILLSSEEPSNYGSFLFRVLPKLSTIARLNLRQPARYLVWAGYPAFRDYLSLLGVSEDQIIDHNPQHVIYRLDHAIVPSLRNNQAFLDPESLAFYAALRERFGAPRRQGQKIYVSRMLHSQSASTRVMRNEAELVERLVRLDFEVVAPETLSAVEQIQAFSSAEMVVGPSGSGMFNVVHCHPGTKIIDIESEPHWIHAHRSLFASCGLRYGIFVGNAIDRNFEEHHKSWTVNINALISRIRSFSRM